jgi:hypothetical protein
VTNPWTKKNPLMSMWLSEANAVANRARGHATAAARKQRVLLTRDAVGFWTGAWLAAKRPKRRR